LMTGEATEFFSRDFYRFISAQKLSQLPIDGCLCAHKCFCLCK
jgi:hypothetical protein